MPKLATLVEKIRSKNAGPFSLTIDIFCKSDKIFNKVCNQLSEKKIAKMFNCEIGSLKKFEITSLKVIKFSLPRPRIQGSTLDRDMHGAAWANLLSDILIT